MATPRFLKDRIRAGVHAADPSTMLHPGPLDRVQTLSRREDVFLQANVLGAEVPRYDLLDVPLHSPPLCIGPGPPRRRDHTTFGAAQRFRVPEQRTATDPPLPTPRSSLRRSAPQRHGFGSSTREAVIRQANVLNALLPVPRAGHGADFYDTAPTPFESRVRRAPAPRFATPGPASSRRPSSRPRARRGGALTAPSSAPSLPTVRVQGPIGGTPPPSHRSGTLRSGTARSVHEADTPFTEQWNRLFEERKKWERLRAHVHRA